MNPELIIVLVLLAAAILMFAFNRPRPDVVALMMMLLLPLTGIIDIGEAIAGFSNSNIVLIGAMFVVGEALARTGVAKRVGDWLADKGGRHGWLLTLLIMLAVGLLGAFMSSTGVVAIFIPVVLRIAARTGIDPAKFLMPMAYAALVSGTITLVATSPNLIINYELMRSGVEGFNFFTFTPFGLPILAVTILYMLVARHWLSPARTGEPAGRPQPEMMDWIERYGLAQREYRVRVLPGSPLLGGTLGDLDLPTRVGVRVLLIERGAGTRRRVLARTPEIRLEAGDILLLDVDSERADAKHLIDEFKVEKLPRSRQYFLDKADDVGLMEVMIPEESPFADLTVAEAMEALSTELTVVGLRRVRKPHPPLGLREEVLHVGDTLLLAGPWKPLRKLQKGGHDLIVLNLPKEFDEVLPKAHKAPQAVLILILTVTLMATGLLPNVHAALLGAFLMGAFGCIKIDQAYRAIQWRSLIMIVGMMPFALALERTGGVALAAEGLVQLLGDANPRIILAALFTLTVISGLFIVNTANAVLLIPIALAVAQHLGASPYPFAMIVALGASITFMTPISPINIMVQNKGNYSFADFVRLGFPLTLIVGTLSVFLVAWLLPLY